jgi:Pyruvate/2-oxoacid:ferredoxin oxidoreductase gamma subunit
MVGAVAHLLPVSTEALEFEIEATFGRLGEKVLAANLDAFRRGTVLASIQNSSAT